MTYLPKHVIQYDGQVSIEISINSRQLTLYLHGNPYGSYPVALGKPSTPTPVGEWHIATKIEYPPWEVLGTRWMGLDVPGGNYGIHGTNAPWSIGRYISNGCIRMYNHDAETVYDLAPIGTSVGIIGSYYVRPAVLMKGSVGQEVARLQSALYNLGFYPGPIDGIFGVVTEESVIRFQKSRGLAADGIVGARTLLEIGLPSA